MLKITAAAAAHIAELTGGGKALRISLKEGGCCGTYYHFSLEPSTAALIVSPEVAPFLNGATLDWGAALKPPRFRVLRNPNTPHKCPCGRSFGAPFPGKQTPRCQAYVPMDWNDT